MPVHAERRSLPFPAAELYELVADVERYPDFLPWCRSVRIVRRDVDIVLAEMQVGFRLLRERFTSRVAFHPPSRIGVSYLDGPFRHLENSWVFTPAETGCVVDFHIDFEFRSAVLRGVIGPVFNEAVRRMVAAFEARAAALYGRASTHERPAAALGAARR